MKRFFNFLMIFSMVFTLSNCKKETSTPINNTPTGGLKDADGNVYTTVTIGKQVWLKQSLKTTKYKNGDPIPVVSDNTAYSALTTGAVNNPENDATLVEPYGKTYNYFAVVDPRGLCPDGFHVPNDADWDELLTTLGGASIAGGKMKEVGTIHWDSPNSSATNSSGFTGLAAGFRALDGKYMHFGLSNYFWSTTEVSSTMANGWYLYYTYGTVLNGGYSKVQAFSVRCLKD